MSCSTFVHLNCIQLRCFLPGLKPRNLQISRVRRTPCTPWWREFWGSHQTKVPCQRKGFANHSAYIATCQVENHFAVHRKIFLWTFSPRHVLLQCLFCVSIHKLFIKISSLHFCTIHRLTSMDFGSLTASSQCPGPSLTNEKSTENNGMEKLWHTFGTFGRFFPRLKFNLLWHTQTDQLERNKSMPLSTSPGWKRPNQRHSKEWI